MIALNNIKTYLLRFTQIQLFLSIISLPILVSWGLPISLMSPISNLVFTPVLSLFLIISSVIFFTELVHIPNGVFIIALEYLTHAWDIVMSWGSNSWLVSFAQPSPLFFTALILAALLILYHPRLRAPLISSACFAALFLSACVFLKVMTPQASAIETIACNGGTVTMINYKNEITLIDPGVIGKRISAPNWIDYTLLPFINKTYGRTTIDHLVILQPGQVAFDAIATLCAQTTVKNCYLILWDGTAPKSLLRSYGAMRRELEKQGSKLHRFGKKPYTIALDKKTAITITPLEKKCTYKDLQFPAVHVTSSADIPVDIYSSKYTPNKNC